MDPVTPTAPHHFPAPPPFAPLASPSPRRQHLTTDKALNPLLSDLSPAATLEALQVDDRARPSDNVSTNFIRESVASASASERAWGIKAALAGKKVQEWYADIAGWMWPGFDQPPLEELAHRRAQHHQGGSIDRSLPPEAVKSSGSNLAGKQATSGLSLKLVQEYEKRIEMVREDMETLEIDDLKNYVRYAHHKTGSRRPSLRDPQANLGLATDYDHLDDFTAIITATIVQALPTISRLETLLNIWSTRLLVLRQVPSFLSDLDSGRESMVSASIAIGSHDAEHAKQRSDFSRKAFEDIRAVLQDQIAELGRKLDRMLDFLEGSADTLPDAWIDDLDEMENQYSTWVVKAERLAINKELRAERLEKDYTQDRADEPLEVDGPLDRTDELLELDSPLDRTNELLELDSPPDLRRSISSSDSDAQFNEIRRRQADSDIDLTRQILMKTLGAGSAVTESSSKSSTRTVDLDPYVPRGALPKQGLREKTQPRKQVLNRVDDQSLKGFSDRPTTPPLRGRPIHRTSHPVLAASRENVKRLDYPDTASDTSSSGSSTSNYSSNKSSPEIQSAVLAEYIGTPARVTSPALSSAEIVFRRLGPPAGGDGANFYQSDIPSELVSKNERDNGGSGHIRTRSGSFRSFDISPKHEIRKIHVQRSGSYSSTISLSDLEYGQVPPSRLPPSFNPQHGEPEALRTTRALPASRDAKDPQLATSTRNLNSRLDTSKRKPLYHSPPPVSVRSSTSAQSSNQEFHPARQYLPYHSPPAVSPPPVQAPPIIDREIDTVEHRLPYHSPPPVQPRITHRFEQVSDLGPGSTPVEIRRMTTSNSIGGHAAGHVETPRTTGGLAVKNLDDQLEERISSILTELPTQIRLTSGPEPDAPEVTRFQSPSNSRTPKARLPAFRLKKRQSSTALPSMTLAPAQPKSSKSRSPTTEPGIKLYHLHQAGKTAPIKLFVRLVGEGGERVMVRIGGGWADLGEYLREYAGHHGQRSVSGSPFDITGLPSSSPLMSSQPPRSRPDSRPASPPSSTKPSPANRLARQQTSPAIYTAPHTPQSDPSARNSQRLSWAGADEASPSLGLAGPKTKNVDISPRKQAWVDEILEKARLGGGEKKGGKEGVVGELGKVGRTRRVFFKGRKEG